MGGICGTDTEMKNLYKIFVEKSERKRQLARPRDRWESHIKLYLKKTRCVWTGFT
jgi:hypothetical protein